MSSRFKDQRIIQHELVNDYVTELYRELGIDYDRKSFYSKGADIDGDVPTEIKAWDETKPSYTKSNYWKRLIYNKILSKFDEECGLIVNTLEIPVKWRDCLRSYGVVPVYLDPKRSWKYHKQLLLSAYQQALSLKSSLHLESTRAIDLSQFEIKFLLEDILPPFEIKYEDQLLESRELYLFSLIKAEGSARGE